MASEILGERGRSRQSTIGNGAIPPMTTDALKYAASTNSPPLSAGPDRLPPDIQKGAETAVRVATQEINVVTVNDNNPSDSSVVDQRTRIRVPSDYLVMLTRGSKFDELYKAGGIIFPYSPGITISHSATYSPTTPTHSNYPIQFYKNSSVSDIQISAVLTVQNDTDAFVYLSIINLLSSLTKMRWGTDSDSGAPPPVCRLDAYGPYMLKNVPIVISEFRHDIPNDVDFYTLTSGKFGVTSVPTKQTITVTCKPIYSRQEMLETSVTKYLSDQNTRKRGFI